ncbi:MAG: DNA polymerase domain-containing protein [Promethearchaeota archaeon]
MSPIRAWLHEIEATDWGVNVYWLTGKKTIRTFYPLTAEFFLAKDDPQIERQLLSHPEIENVTKVSKYLSIHDHALSDVFRVQVNPQKIRSTYEDLRKYWSDYLHNADLSLWQQFCFQTGLFPYAYATIKVANGELKNWDLLESYVQMDYQAVPFKTLWLQPIFRNPHLIEKRENRITKFLLRKSVIDQDEEPVVFEEDNEENLIRDCVHYVQKNDPDILFTRGGDTFFPIIAHRAVRAGIGNLRLGRGKRTLSSYLRYNKEKQGYIRYKEGQREVKSQRGHSFVSYGRVYFSQFGVYLDGGRHHYDVGNSFMWKDGNIEGIQELVRLGCSDPQRIARGTIGTTLSAVQMRTAYHQGILIPARKADAESFRPAWSLQSDVGGLVFSPRVGFHANVTELDFLSMYPNIMVHKNVSPETVNCKCCTAREAQPVPLTEYHICTRRPGLVSLSLENILNRRQYFKAKRNLHSIYDRRQKVLKWLLVCCFGYQGYRNARFGRIESHETISAYGRHALTLTQQLASRYGLEVVAGIVDSVWLKNSDEEPVPIEMTRELRQEVANIVKLPVEHSADYHWMVFLPRRYEPEIGVLNRYYGVKTDGTFRIRGIEIRQSSSPSFIKKLQMNMLKILAKARTREEYRLASLRAKRFIKRCTEELEAGNIPHEELFVTIRPSRAPDEYVNNSRQAIAAKQLAALGVNVEPGVKIRYLIIDAQAKDWKKRVKAEQLLRGNEQYDVNEYRKLILRAYENLIPPEFHKKDMTLESFF